LVEAVGRGTPVSQTHMADPQRASRKCWAGAEGAAAMNIMFFRSALNKSEEVRAILLTWSALMVIGSNSMN
jgi:hypothetical protein